MSCTILYARSRAIKMKFVLSGIVFGWGGADRRQSNQENI